MKLRATRLTLTGPGARTASAFSISDLFKGSEQGFHLEAYDPAELVPRTNHFLHTEDIRQAIWSKGGSPSPAVATSATKVSLPATNAQLVQAFGVTVRPGDTWTAGIELSGVEGETVQLVFTRFGSGPAEAVAANITLTAVPTVHSLTREFLNPQTGVELRVVRTAANTAAEVTVSKAQLNRGSTLLRYSAITDWYTEFMAAGGERVTMFQDAACTTPVTAIEQLIGGWITTERGTKRGPERVTTPTVNGVSIGGPTTTTYTTGASVLGTRVYEVSFTVSDYAGTGTVGLSTPISLQAPGNGTYRAIVTSTGGNANVPVFTRSTNTCNFSNISVREIPGKVATQAASTSRPKLDARLNLFVKTEQMDDAAWSLQGTTATRSTKKTARGVWFWEIAKIDDTTSRFIRQTVTSLGNPATPATLAVTLRAGTSNKCSIGLFDGSAWGGATTAQIVSGPGSLTGGSSGLRQLTGLSPDEDTVIAVTRVDFAGSAQLLMYPDQSTSAVTGASVLMAEPDLRPTAHAVLDVPPYQRVTTPTDYEAEGFPHRIRGDGADDALQLPLDMSASSSLDQMVSGNVKVSDAAANVITEHTENSGTVPGAFALLNQTLGRLVARSLGSTVAEASSTSGALPAPQNGVLHQVAEIANDVLTLSLDGTQIATSSTDQGTGTFANSTFNIFARNNSGQRNSSGLSGITVRGGRLTPAQVAELRSHHSQLAKIK